LVSQNGYYGCGVCYLFSYSENPEIVTRIVEEILKLQKELQFNVKYLISDQYNKKIIKEISEK